MINESPDPRLISAYATEGSEAAFRALVARHVNLVYSTALRQVGDHGLAEEITQNVFVVLARKAPRLGGMETVAGWLHRTAILEAKARIRSELRRKRREETAAALVSVEPGSESTLDTLAPLLDEALLHLRENDRLAIVLRFLEDRSLRDVGTSLGIDEDAARKRVVRALERLTEFFRQRGFAVPTAAACATLIGNSMQAAPAALAMTSANAGLAAAGTSTGLKLILFHLMALTKTQTAVVCLLLVSAPLLWQRHAHARIAEDHARISVELAPEIQKTQNLESEAERLRLSLQRIQEERADAEARLSLLNAQRAGRAPIPEYAWDDNSPVLRVPKQTLAGLSIAAVESRRGTLSQPMKEVLQVTPEEAGHLQAAIDHFRDDFFAAQAKKTSPVSPTENELQGGKPEEARVFEIADTTEELRELRNTFYDELGSVLDAQRAWGLRQALGDWMPAGDLNEDFGLNSTLAIVHKKHRVGFYQPEPGDKSISWALYGPNGGSVHVYIPLDEIPGPFQESLADWIALAKSGTKKE